MSNNAEMARGIEICMNEWDRMKAVWIAKFGNTDGFGEHFSREVGIFMDRSAVDKKRAEWTETFGTDVDFDEAEWRRGMGMAAA